MTPTPTAWSIESSEDNKNVQVRREGDTLAVDWICGYTFRFGRGQLGQAIAHAEDLEPLDVWLRLTDIDDERFVVKVADGRLHARTGPFGIDTGSVDWPELRELLAPPPPPVAPELPWAELTRWQRLWRWLRQ